MILREIHRLLPLAAFTTLLALSLPTSASLLFSVDIDTDELVRIDSNTGTVSIVGALGQDAFDVDLTRTSDGRLFGLNSQFGSRVDLWTINPLSGAVTSSIQVTRNGASVLSAEALGSVGNNLKIGFDTAVDSASESLGDLSETGVVTNGVSFASIPMDFDGLGSGDALSPLYGVDRFRVNINFTDVAAVDNPGPGITVLGSYPANSVVANDVVLVGNDLFLSDNAPGNGVLHSVDRTTGVLTTTTLDRNGRYLGIAVANPVSAPEPPMALLLLAGLAGVLYKRRR